MTGAGAPSGFEARQQVGLAILAVSLLGVGGWALFAPTSFYADFPGWGVGWVSLLPPYNAHLVTDVGGLDLGLGVVLAWAAATLERQLVRAALVGLLIVAVPHLGFHLTHLDGFGLGDALAQTASLLLQVVLPVALLLDSWRAGRRPLESTVP